MKFLFWLLGLFALAVAVTLAAHNPGYLLLVYPPYRVEMSLSLFVVALVAVFVAGYLLIRLAAAALNLPAYVRRFRKERNEAKRRIAMMEALDAFLEGRYAAAERQASRALELGDMTPATPIIAARAAHELREFDRRDAYLAAGAAQLEKAPAMRFLTLAKFHLDQREPEAALDALRTFQATGQKGHLGALYLELKAQQQAGNWDAVLEIVRQLEKRDAIDAAMATQLRQQAWLVNIRARAGDAAELKAVWKIVPEEFKLRGRIAATAAHAFIRLDDYTNAREILTDSLNAQWDSELTRLYGDCVSEDAIGQIEQAERWLAMHSNDAGLLLALGKLCLHQRLWGKAQNYLEASISVSPSRDAYTARGQLAEILQKPDEAAAYFQKAMRLVGIRSDER